MGMSADDAALLSAALVEDQLLEAPADEYNDQDAKKEVLNHLENFASLRDSDFLPPGMRNGFMF